MTGLGAREPVPVPATHQAAAPRVPESRRQNAVNVDRPPPSAAGPGEERCTYGSPTEPVGRGSSEDGRPQTAVLWRLSRSRYAEL